MTSLWMPKNFILILILLLEKIFSFRLLSRLTQPSTCPRDQIYIGEGICAPNNFLNRKSEMKLTFIKEFEEYLFSDDKSQVVSRLSQGNPGRNYLELTSLIQQIGGEDPSNLNKIWDIFNALKPSIDEEQQRNLKYTILLKEFDINTTTDKRRDEIINEIKKDLYPNVSFDFPPPVEFTSNHQNNLPEFSNKLDTSKFDPYQIVKEYYENDLHVKREIDKNVLLKYLELKKVPDKKLISLMRENKMNGYQLSREDLKTIGRAMDRYVIAEKTFPFEKNIFFSYTLNQLVELFNLVDDAAILKIGLFNAIIYKKYFYRFEISDRKLNPSELSQLLQEVINYMEIYNYGKSQLASITKLKLLEINLKLGEHDLKLFKSYLKTPTAKDYSIFKWDDREYEVTPTKFEFYGLENFLSLQSSENELIEEYLKYFFIFDRINNVTLQHFIPYFNYNYLINIYLECWILRGKPTDSVMKFFGKEKFEEISSRSELTILKNNKEKYEIDGEVLIELQIKNVNNLLIKIFEINTENYYLTYKKKFDESLNLDGLISPDEINIKFKDNPQILIRRKLKIPDIPNKRGLYIIEFIGNGISSRAIIQKGALSYFTKNTELGKEIFILTENNQIATNSSGENNSNSKTGVWFKNDFYTANHNGKILIPYMKQESTDIMILKYGDFSEFIEGITIEEERYIMEGIFFADYESLVPGNLGKFLVTPKLFLNGIELNLSLIKNIRIRVETEVLHDNNSVKSIRDYKNLKLNENNQVIIQLEIQNKLTQINLIFIADIHNNSKSIEYTLSFQKSFVQQSNNNAYDFYLKKVNEENILYLLWKNGDPKKNSVVELRSRLNYLISPAQNEDRQSLLTNERGEVFLGNLTNVERIAVSTGDNRQEKLKESNFEIPLSDVYYEYPQVIDLIEGENIKLPFYGIEKMKNNTNFLNNLEYLITLIKVSENGQVLDLIPFDGKTLNIITININLGLYEIHIKNLTEGNYQLNIAKNKVKNVITKIFVHSKSQPDISLINRNNSTIISYKNNLGESESFSLIPTENKIIKNSDLKDSIHIRDIKFESRNKKIKIKISSKTKYPRVHLYAYNFQDKFNGHDLFKMITNLNRGRKIRTVFDRNTPNNIYLINRRLDDETQYVIDRINSLYHSGVNLDSPTLLLNREFVRNTTVEEEKLNEGSDFKQSSAIPKLVGANYFEKASIINEITDDLDKFNFDKYNFLNNSSLVIFDKISDDEGWVVIENFDYNVYSQIFVFAVDEKSFFLQNFYLNNNSESNVFVNKKDLRLTQTLEKSKYYSEIKKINLIRAGESFTNDSLNNNLIDSLDKIVSYKLTINPELRNKWKIFEFLLRINELSKDELKAKISETFSHELNAFLFFKYPNLYQTNIVEVIKYKSEKTFLDLFFLKDRESLLQFLTPSKLNTLSSFEKCMLILFFHSDNLNSNHDNNYNNTSSIGDSNYNVKNILNSLKFSSEENKIETDEWKNYFNVLINTKNIQDMELVFTGLQLEETVTELAAVRSLSNLTTMNLGEVSAGLDLNSESIMATSRPSPARNSRAAVLRSPILPKSPFLYQEKVKEYKERHFYEDSKPSQKDDNYFWYDFGNYLINDKSNDGNGSLIKSKKFLSENIILKSNTISDLIFVLSVLDLPPTSNSRIDSINYIISDKNESFKTNSNIILVKKSIEESEYIPIKDIVVTQKISEFFPNSDISKSDDSSYNINEYIKNKIYREQISVSNMSNKKQNLELLIQIPEGAVPLFKSDYIETIPLVLEVYKNALHELFFFFPEVGNFFQFGPSVSLNSTVISKLEDNNFIVKQDYSSNTNITLESISFNEILRSKSTEKILYYFSNRDFTKEDIKKIYFFLKNKSFYEQFIRILKSKKIYDEVVWQFSLLHKDDISTIKDLLETNIKLKNYLGPIFNCSLITIDDSNNYNILNYLYYYPLINARTYSIHKNKISIQNTSFRKTYEEFIFYLLTQNKIHAKYWVRIVNYLILQERLTEARDLLNRVIPEEISNTRINLHSNKTLSSDTSEPFSSYELQYDYILAYLDFAFGNPNFNQARTIIEKYKNLSYNRWKELFDEISHQLNEFDTGEDSIDDSNILNILDERKKQILVKRNILINKPTLSFVLSSDRKLSITYSNLDTITIKLYLIDLELIFSKSPFLKKTQFDFSFIIPSFTESINVEKSKNLNTTDYYLLDKFSQKDFIIEATSDSDENSVKYFENYFSNSIKVIISESLGELQVSDLKNKPLNAVYVKCFAKKKTGRVLFYKDGYTDLRGRFNYFSLNTDNIKNNEKFALLIKHKTLGSVIREISPPINILNATELGGFDEYEAYKREYQDVVRRR